MTPRQQSANAPLDLAKWRNVPFILMGAGGLLSALGLLVSWSVKHSAAEFLYAWLLAFMFFLSLCLGALFLVLAYHLFDAGWSVPIRRFCEHIASMLFPWMLILWIPIVLLRTHLY